MNRCIMAATDGEPGADGALRCATDIAGRLGLPLEIVTVCEPDLATGAGALTMRASEMAERAEHCRCHRRRTVTRQLLGLGIESQPFIDVEIGSPAPAIARAALRRGSPLVAVGRGRRGLDRLLTDEAALRLMQASHVPILSVPSGYSGLPTRAVAALDFSSYSMDAARAALMLLSPRGELHLVYVADEQPVQGLGSRRREAWEDSLREEVQARLDAAAAELSAAAPEITVATHLLSGRPVQTVLRLAAALEADMLAAGTNGYGFLGRLLMGSVATQLVRRSDFLTLIAPPRGTTPGADYLDSATRRTRAALVKDAMATVREQAS